MADALKLDRIQNGRGHLGATDRLKPIPLEVSGFRYREKQQAFNSISSCDLDELIHESLAESLAAMRCRYRN